MSDRRPALTAQQKAAIETRGVSIGLSAGAGCGKTFVLTQRFLTHLEPGERTPRVRATKDQLATGTARGTPAPQMTSAESVGAERLSQIVAITFTDRAAREMRDRIRAACQERVENCPPDDVAQWLAILRAIDGARISTIHAFCAAFLRRHAVEAGVDPQFRLMDADLGEALVRTTLARTVKRLLETGNEACLQLVVHYGLEGTRRILRQLLSAWATSDTRRFSEYDARKFAAEWVDHFQTIFLPRLLCEFASSDAVAEIIDLLRENESSNPTMQDRRLLLLDRLEMLRGRAVPCGAGVSPALPSAQAVEASLDEIRQAAQVKGAGNKQSWPSETVYEAVKSGFERLRTDIDRIVEWTELDATALAQSSELAAAAVTVVDAAAADLAAAKHAAGLLDFDDLLVKTRDLLRDSEEVRRETAGSIRALLVDEFQDTDPVQAEIVEALAGGGGGTGAPRPPSAMFGGENYSSLATPNSRSIASAGPTRPCSTRCGPAFPRKAAYRSRRIFAASRKS